MKLLESRTWYKPFAFPWAFDGYKAQKALEWLPSEVPLLDDVKDWNQRLTAAERNLLTQIFRFFTQADVDIASAYYTRYLPVFSHPELRMMLGAFASMEGTHMHAYSLLLDTVGMPESEYQAFESYQEMRDKHDYMFGARSSGDPIMDLAIDLGVFSAFGEGMQLFSSFAILQNFARFGKMRGMNTIVTWSIRDECYAEGTEVLTPRGWIDLADLTDQDQVAQWDDGLVRFVLPSRRVEYEFDGTLCDFSAKCTPLRFSVTPNHDVVHFDDYHGTAPRKLKAETFQGHARRRIPVSGVKLDGRHELTPLERVRIAFAADGTRPDDRHNGRFAGYLRVSMNLKKERKKLRLRHLLSQADLSYDEKPLDDDMVLFRFNGPLDMSKSLSHWVELTEVSAEWCDEFINELAQWDGHDRYGDGSYIVYGTTQAQDRDLVQAICALSGRVCTVTTSIDPRGHKTYYRLNIRHLDRLRTGQLDKIDRPYHGKVRCVTVPSGAVLTRYQGGVCVSGNSLHVECMIKLFRTLVNQYPQLQAGTLGREITEVALCMVTLEDHFIDLAFAEGGIEGLTADEVKVHIRFLCDRRMEQLGYPVIYRQTSTPLTWLDHILNGVEHTNFFEQRSTDYAKASLTGSWEELGL